MKKVESVSVPSNENKLGTFSGRLELVIGSRSYREYADSIDVSEGTVRNYLKGGSPKIDVLDKICKQDGINLNWLIAGIGDKQSLATNKVQDAPSNHYDPTCGSGGFLSKALTDTSTQSHSPGESEKPEITYHVISKPELNEEFVLIPGYHARVPSKCGSLSQNEHEVKRYLAFRKKYLNYKKLDPSKLAVVFAAGDAMDGSKGTIKDNDTLLVDLTSTKPLDGKIFVVRLGDEIHPRRIQKGFDGSITLICDNEEYSNQILREDQINDLEIIGRVVHRSTDL